MRESNNNDESNENRRFITTANNNDEVTILKHLCRFVASYKIRKPSRIEFYSHEAVTLLPSHFFFSYFSNFISDCVIIPLPNNTTTSICII